MIRAASPIDSAGQVGTLASSELVLNWVCGTLNNCTEH